MKRIDGSAGKPKRDGMGRLAGKHGRKPIQRSLCGEDWDRLLHRLVAFTKRQIRQRGLKAETPNMLLENPDANSIAAEVIWGALRGNAQLSSASSFDKLENELQRLVRDELSRLDELKKAGVIKSECRTAA